MKKANAPFVASGEQLTASDWRSLCRAALPCGCRGISLLSKIAFRMEIPVAPHYCSCGKSQARPKVVDGRLRYFWKKANPTFKLVSVEKV